MSVPLAAVCFVLFPRVAGQFWALQRGEQATTGLSDEMSPGSISKLANEYDPAFRVRFDGNPPPQSALYWRGPVLNDFDGFTWRRLPAKYYTQPRIELLGEPLRYRVTLEPTNQRWLFALDTLAANPRRDFSMAAHDRQLSMSTPDHQRAELRRGLEPDDAQGRFADGPGAAARNHVAAGTQSACPRAGARSACAQRQRRGVRPRGACLVSRQRARVHARTRHHHPRLGGHHAVRQQERFLRSLRVLVRHDDARRRSSGAHRNGLSGR